jgi:hypothetical protein
MGSSLSLWFNGADGMDPGCRKFYQLAKQDDGSYLYSVPTPADTVLPSFAVEQTGEWVVAAFNDPAKWIGGCCVSSNPVQTLLPCHSTLSLQHIPLTA